MSGTPQLPGALEAWPGIVERLANENARALAVFLDYDGTLAPIVARPELAQMDPATALVVEQLATRVPVAIVTGRALADVRERVGLSSLYYAANHGFEIEGPSLRHRPFEGLAETFAHIARRLEPVVRQTRGAVMEAKGYSVAVHYRQVADVDVGSLEAAVDELIAERTDVRKTTGKKLLEVRPAVAWNKGAAVHWLLDHWDAAGQRHFPLFFGDDRTDEDAFAAIADRGIGVFVGTPGWETAAHYGLTDTAAVTTFLQRLLAIA
jgi:alpha,alpha-trehalase